MNRLLPAILIAASVLLPLSGCGVQSRVTPVERGVKPAAARQAAKPAARALPPVESPQRPFLTNHGATSGSFAPAGDQIIFAGGRPGSQNLFLVRPDGAQAHPLGPGGYDDVQPTWSPQGEAVAFVRRNGSTSSLLLFSFARKGIESLLDSKEALKDPAWLPGGRGLVFVSVKGEQTTLFRLEFGGSPVSLWRGPAGAHPTVSAQGQVVFEAGDGSGRSVLMSVPLAGGGAERLDASGDRPRQPAFSPSGRSLAYVADDGLYVSRADGTSAKRIASGSGLSAPRWNPRAAQILVTADRRGAASDLQIIALPTP